MEAYLKNVAMRRDVAKVHEAMAKGTKVIPGMEGVPAMRIASEQGREFIFKSNPERAESESQDGFKAALTGKGSGRGMGARKVQKPGALKWRPSEKDKVESYKEKPSWFKASPYGLGEVKMEPVSDGDIGVVKAEPVGDVGYGELQVVKGELDSGGGSGKILVAIDPELAVLDTSSQWSTGARSGGRSGGGRSGGGREEGGREGRGRGGRGDNGADKFLGGWMKVLKLTKDEVFGSEDERSDASGGSVEREEEGGEEWEDGAGGDDVAVSVGGAAEAQGDDLFTADIFKKGGTTEKLDPEVVAEVARAAAERLAKANGMGRLVNGMGGTANGTGGTANGMGGMANGAAETEEEGTEAEIRIGIQIAEKDGGERWADVSGRGADASVVGNGQGLVVSKDEMDWEDGGVLETGGMENTVAVTDQTQTDGSGEVKTEGVEGFDLEEPRIASRGRRSGAGNRVYQETLVLTADGESMRPIAMDDGSDVEWEDGSGQFGKADPVPEPSDFSVGQSETAGSLDDLATLAAVLDDPTGALPSIGALAEDADLEEAIRRSLTDFQGPGGAAAGGRPSKGIIIREGKGAEKALVEANDGKQLVTEAVREVADEEEAFLARERARKGKGRVGEEPVVNFVGPDLSLTEHLTKRSETKGAANNPSNVQTANVEARAQQADNLQVNQNGPVSQQGSDQPGPVTPLLGNEVTLPPSTQPSVSQEPKASAPAATVGLTVPPNPAVDLTPPSNLSSGGILTPLMGNPSKPTPPVGSNPVSNPLFNPLPTPPASDSRSLPSVRNSFPLRSGNLRNPFADDAPPSFPDIDELLEDEEELSEDRHELERREKEAQDWERAEQETLEMEAAIAESLLDSVSGAGGPEFRGGETGTSASGMNGKQVEGGESSRRETAGSSGQTRPVAGLSAGGSSGVADTPSQGVAHEPDAAPGGSGGVRLVSPRGGEVTFEEGTQQGRLLREQETRRAEREKLAEEKAKRELLEKEAEMQDERERLAAEEAALQVGV